MLQKPQATVTPGRNLFNCSPLQWEQFTNPEVNIPRTGLLEEAAEGFGMKVEEVDGLWYVHNAEGLRFAEAERNRRQALHTWWIKDGLHQVSEHRKEHRQFENMRQQGRPSPAEGTQRQQQADERSAALNLIFSKLNAVWLKAKEILLSHSPQAEVWMVLAEARDMPRRNNVNRIGERKAIVQALQALYDTTAMNPVINTALNGSYPGDDALSTALMGEFPQLGMWGEAAGLMPRMALMTALQLSEEPAQVLFEQLNQALLDNDIKNTEELQHLCGLVVR